MTSCALPRPSQLEEDFQSTALQSTGDDNDKSLMDI